MSGTERKPLDGFDQDTEAYRSGQTGGLVHTRLQERLERAKAGLSDLPDEPRSENSPNGPRKVVRDNQGYVCWPPFHDPKGESVSVRECGKEYAEVEPGKARAAMPHCLNDILRWWVVAETGRLSHPLHRPGRDAEAADADIELLAWLWVAQTPGWCLAVHEVMRHIFVRGKTWDEWPRFRHRTAEIVERQVFGPWLKGETPRFVTEWQVVEVELSVSRERAVKAWKAFRPELERRAKEEPFYGEQKSVSFA